MVPLDASLVRGSHGLFAADTNDGPLLIADESAPDGTLLPMTMIRVRVLGALELAEE